MVDSIGALDALSAYQRTRPAGDAAGARPSSATIAEPTDAVSFGDIVTRSVGATADALGKAEQASIKQVAGKGDLIDVATAIGAAETALDTMVAVRDRVVSAYNEIMRMQI